jgi:hypothetical protein
MIGRGLRGLGVRGGTAFCNVIDPLRLTDRFDFLRGYMPSVLAQEEPEKERREREAGGGANPFPPVVDSPPVGPLGRATVSSSLARAVRAALVEFLAHGAAVAPTDLVDVVAVTLVDPKSGTAIVELRPADDAPAGSSPANAWVPALLVSRLEDELRATDPTANLQWLLSAAYAPSTNTPLHLEVFSKKVDRVRKGRLYTEAAYMQWQLEVH